MRYKKVAVLILAAPLAAFALAKAARHPQQDSRDQSTQDQSKPGMPGGGITSPEMIRSGRGMMDGGVMTSRMMAHRQEMGETMNKLIESMTAIENETDPAALKSRLAEHRALLEQMRNQMTQQSMMQSMMHEMGGKVPRVPLTPRVWK
jgi:hypothetical protein